MAVPTSKKTEPISILKAPPPISYAGTSTIRTEQILLSEDEEEDPRYMISDGEDEDPALVPSGKALELLQTEKVIHSGYLLKKGEKRRTWKKRWFVLRTTKLAMYKDKKEYKLLRIIDLQDIQSVIQVTSKDKYRYVFAIYTPKRTYFVQADDQNTMNKWFEAIEQTKGELNEDTSSTGQQDLDFSKEVVSSYKSNTSNISNSTTYTNSNYSQQRRPSGGILIDTRRPSTGIVNTSPSSSTAFSPNNNNNNKNNNNNNNNNSNSNSNSNSISNNSNSNNNHSKPSDKTTGNLRINVLPVDIPKPQVTFSPTINDDSANIYPVSPTFDQYHPHSNDGYASSDDDEYSAANSIINIKREEDRNRVLVEGYLLKLGRNKGWQKRWFVLRTDTLAYYEDNKEYSPHRIIPLNHIKNSKEIEPMSKNKQHCFKISIPKRQYVLCASTENDMKSWLNALNITSKQINNKETSDNHQHHPPQQQLSQAHPTTAIEKSPSNKPIHPHHPLHHHHHHPTSRLEQIPEVDSSSGSPIARKPSLDSFENVSHISGVSGNGGIGGAGGCLGRR